MTTKKEQKKLDLIASGNYEECKCGAVFKKITSRHKSICELWPSTSKPKPCLCGHESTSRTQMKRHRSKCDMWKNRDKTEVQKKRVLETLQGKWGDHVKSIWDIPGVEEKRKMTSLERYGHENPSQSEEVKRKHKKTVSQKTEEEKKKSQEKAKQTNLKRRGVENPFQCEEVKRKIENTHLKKRGVTNPQKDPKVRTKTKKTNLERRGIEEVLACPKIRKKIKETCNQEYGGNAPSCDPKVLEKAKQTNLKRWGVPWTCMDPEVRRKQLETMEKNFGSHFFASDEGKEKAKEGMLRKYNVENYAQIEGYWEEQVARFVKNFGVTHPLQLAEFLDKRRETCQKKYGYDNPLQSPEVMANMITTNQGKYGFDYAFLNPVVQEKIKETNQERYGFDYAIQAFEVREKTIRTCLSKVDICFPEYEIPARSEEDLLSRYGISHPMKNRKYALHQLKELFDPYAGPNKFEQKVGSLHDNLMYTGNRKFWRWLPKLEQHKNPDFIIPGPNPEKPLKGVTSVVEAFGFFWHSRMFTGKANFDHEQELIEAYEDVGIRCLVIWEQEMNDLEQVKQRLEDFLNL